jgi:Zn-dependent metalloprotease/Leucine-rich repeat (LRR) protein
MYLKLNIPNITMKSKFSYLLLCVSITMSSLLYGQTLKDSNAEKVVNGSNLVRLNEKNKSIQFIGLKNEARFDAINQTVWLKNALKLTTSHTLQIVSKSDDKKAFTHAKYQINYKNLPVEGAVYTIHSSNGKVISASGNYIPGQELDIIPNITEKEAFNSAIKYVNAKQYRWDSDNTGKPSGQLVIFTQENKYILAYKFDIYAIDPLSRQYIFVNANTGSIIATYNRIQNIDAVGFAETLYNGIVNITADSVTGYFRLRESGRGSGIETYDLNNSTNYLSAVDFTDDNNYWNETANYDNAAYDAHYATEATYDYYYNFFGRNSYDDNGGKLISYIHYSTNYVNAFWNGEYMTYGDGDGVTYLPLTPIEVVAHEITHGVTERTAGLIYANESGALNESFSDIFGIVIDFYRNLANANYEMGDAMSPSHTPFRSMSNPNAYGCPDTYLGTYWDPSQEVHTNSGVMNFWFYLLAEGGTGINDIGNSYAVTAIGRDKAAQIAYRNLTVYLVPNSTYADARFYAIQSAIDLFGDCSPEVVAVTNAWHAVGVGDSFNGSVTASFLSSTTNACKLPATVYFYNQSQKASTYIWDFGDGTTDNTTNPIHIYNAAGTYTVNLIASGSAVCSSSDTATKENYISVSDIQAPANAACIPFTRNASDGGIYKFSFNTINNITSGSADNYQDYSCSHSTNVMEGRAYDMIIKVGNTHQENVAVWADMNNNGQFTEDEILFKKDRVSKSCTTKVNIPAGVQYNIPLRLRVISDFADYAISNACNNTNYGQAQDYSIVVGQNNNPPEADFFSNKTDARSGDTLEFIDHSLNLPTSWEWSFPGGEPSSSNEQNPRIAYNSPGVYNVSLIAHNAFGTGSITKTGYISVTNTPPAGLKATLVDKNLGVVKLSWLSAPASGIFEDFNDGVANNFVFYNSYTYVENGVLKAYASGDNTWAETYYNQDFQDFTMEYRVKKDQGSADASLGILFRSSGSMNTGDASGYLLCTTASGYYSVFRMTSGSATNLIPWTASSAINTGFSTWNIITIEASGSSIKFYVNSQYVNEINDANYTSGRFSFCSYLTSGYTNDISWDDISIIPQAGIITNTSDISKAINTKLNGVGSLNMAPKNPVMNNHVEVKGLINGKITALSAFQHYNIYRDSSLLNTTIQTEYYDSLQVYGTYQYSVTSQYDDSESTASGPVSIIWSEPNPGESCENAQDLSALTSPYSGTTVGYVADFSYCGMGSSPDRVFYIDMLPDDILTIGQSSNDYDSRHSLRAGGNCPGDNEIVCIDDPDIQTHVYTNNTGTTQRVYWIQAGYSSNYGNFILQWNIEHVTCPKPVSLSVSDVKYRSARLSWIPGGAELEWEVEWGITGFVHGEGTIISGITSDSLDLNSLNIATKYDFYVRAVCDITDKSNWSGPYSFTTLNLSKPYDFTANIKDMETGVVELTWKDGNTEIREDFNDGLADNWTPVTGNWLVENQAYSGYSSDSFYISTSSFNNNFNAFELEALMTASSSSSAYLGLEFNGDPLSLDGAGDWTKCYLYMYTTDGIWSLNKLDNGYWTQLNSGSSSDIHQGTGASNTLKVVYSNGTIDCYINGILQGSTYDTTYLSGDVGLHSHSLPTEKSVFDNFILKPLASGYSFGKVNQPSVRDVFRFNYFKNSKELSFQENAPLLNNQLPITYWTSDSVLYNIYHNNIIIDTTSQLTYTDILPGYGIHEYKISAVYPEGESQTTNPVNIEWYGNPIISVNPSSFNETLLSGDSITRDLTITNTGSGQLIFNISKIAGIQNNNLVRNTIIPASLNISRNTLDESQPVVLSKPRTIMSAVGDNVLIFRDNLAWGFDVNVPILESLGANVTIAGSADMGTIDLNNFKLIIFESQQPLAFYDSYNVNFSRFENYLQTGGVIEFHCATWTSYRLPNLSFPGGLQTLTSEAISGTNYIIDKSHPIVNGISETVTGNSASHEAFENIPGNADIITENESGYPTTVEYTYGQGTMIVTGMTWEIAYAVGWSFGNMLSNALQYSLDKKSYQWLSTSLMADTLSSGESVIIELKFNAKDLIVNNYYETLVINSTGLNDSLVNVPCTLRVIGKPNADFKADATQIVVGDNVQFTDMSTGVPNAWQWSFSGGSPSGSDLQNPTVAFNTVGTYDVTLIINNDYGADTLTRYSYIQVNKIENLTTDSLALVAFYNSTNGPGWTNNSNWLTGPISSWNGVYIENGRVIGISLWNNNLTGPIPPEIANLTQLRDISLCGNQLNGKIPHEIGNLFNLQNLILCNNQLSDSIPVEIGNLTNLYQIYLGQNMLSGSIPPEIGSLPYLYELMLYNNQLSGEIPAEIGNLTNLQNIQLSDNKLTGAIPSELGNLLNLRTLFLNQNNLTGNLPVDFGNLVNLQVLHIGGNQLSGNIPHEIGYLTNMQFLYCGSNQFSGDVPNEIQNLVNLEGLDLSNNQLEGLPQLNTMTLLSFLNTWNNKFTFEDIEPNIGIATSFYYAPQDSVGIEATVTVNENEQFFTFIAVGGEHNVYQWFKDGNLIPGEQNDALIIANTALSDAGVYSCQITNTVATELTLYSRPITLVVQSSPTTSSYVSPVRSMTIPFNSDGIVIDGVDDEADYSSWQSTDAFNPIGSTGADADFTMQFKVCYDANYLYFFAKILDDYESDWEWGGSNQWTYDGVELYMDLDTNGSGNNPAYDSNTYQIRFNRGIDSVGNDYGRGCKRSDHLYYWENTSDGWLFEAAIDWKFVLGLGQRPEDIMQYFEDGVISGFDVSGFDSDTDGPDHRDCQTAWDNDDPADAADRTEDNAWNNRTVFGTIEFLPEGVTPPPPHFTPVWSGNGIDQINFYTLTAKIDGVNMQPGDEIGIFDGNICVGAGVLTEVLDTFNFLVIQVSADDDQTPEIDGYTTGNTASFKLWDDSEVRELNHVNINYVEGNNIFNPDNTSPVYHINGFFTLDQSIALTSGWNIFSLYAAPEDSAMLSIVQPLINGGSLIKVQNEAGKAIEYITPLHRWVDKIGKWQSTEGYKIRVNTNTTLNVTGTPIDLPIAIPLTSGWNIAGYPVSSSQDAMDAFNQLITNGSLVKVQNEGGKAIEYITPLHRWVDKIDTLVPDEGYKVRVNKNDVLTINDAVVTGFAGSSTAGSSTDIESISGKAGHFSTCWSGNGLDQMNLYFMLKNAGLQAGDEIGIFDADLCVGAGIVADPEAEFISLIASSDDPSTTEKDGFTEGNKLQLKVWKANANKVETLNNIQYLDDTKNLFEAMGTVFSVVNSSTIGVEDFSGRLTCLGNCYPNPFSHSTHVPFTIAEETEVDLAVYDMLGQRLNVLIHATMSPGNYSIEWVGNLNNGGKVRPGVYFIKMVADNHVLTQPIELINY